MRDFFVILSCWFSLSVNLVLWHIFFMKTQITILHWGIIPNKRLCFWIGLMSCPYIPDPIEILLQSVFFFQNHVHFVHVRVVFPIIELSPVTTTLPMSTLNTYRCLDFERLRCIWSFEIRKNISGGIFQIKGTLPEKFCISIWSFSIPKKKGIWLLKSSPDLKTYNIYPKFRSICLFWALLMKLCTYILMFIHVFFWLSVYGETKKSIWTDILR